MATSATNSPRSVPLRSALRDETDDSDKAPKAVQINDDVAAIPPPTLPPADGEPALRKQFSANLGRRLSSRASVLPVSSSRTSLVSVDGSQTTTNNGTSSAYASPAMLPVDENAVQVQGLPSVSPSLRPHVNRRRSTDVANGRLLAQIAEWIQQEKARRGGGGGNSLSFALGSGGGGSGSGGGATSSAVSVNSTPSVVAEDPPSPRSMRATPSPRVRPRTGSTSSNGDSLDRLQRILDDGMASLGIESLGPYYHHQHHHHVRSGSVTSTHHRRRSLARGYSSGQGSRTAASSDTEYVDGDAMVPGCDAVLDNSRTLKYAGVSGGSGSFGSDNTDDPVRAAKEKAAWLQFNNEIIRLAHTLRIKGWRRVPLESGDTITVERLSGALTNAVYVVTPPPEIKEPPKEPPKDEKDGTETKPEKVPRRSKPRKLLLRIYGPQVEHLIDRENELSVLRRLARKKIGPRVLGTFANGRFEQYFVSTTLTAASLREPETSKQIAKRMRELHDGVALLESERDAGPNVWRNWDKWLDAVERAITHLDRLVEAASTPDDPWKHRGYVCGAPWPLFRSVAEKHRDSIVQYYGGPRAIRDKLVFAHNDTQYGNILRIRPDNERSPLVQPENEHRQLVVIDFEYAAANLPALEFANHFTEWTYNYHNAAAPHACTSPNYPTIEQQRRFLRAYVEHRPFSTPRQRPVGAGGTPNFGASTPAIGPSSSSIAEFMLDARAPPGGWHEEERRRDEAVERQVEELMTETRMWRIANSAMWVAWGLVQAKVDDKADDKKDGEEEDFDYLSYAQDRAYFFWGDCVQAGLVKRDELPAELQAKLKVVEY